jgi:tetratricopeptide (TPR) repeat protein
MIRTKEQKAIIALKRGLNILADKYINELYDQERVIDDLNSDINHYQRQVDNLEIEMEKDNKNYHEDIEYYEKIISENKDWEGECYKMFDKIYGHLRGTERQKKWNEIFC